MKYFREIFSNYIFWIQHVSTGPLVPQIEDKVTTSSKLGSAWQNYKLHWLEEWNGKYFHPSRAELLPTIREGHFPLDSGETTSPLCTWMMAFDETTQTSLISLCQDTKLYVTWFQLQGKQAVRKDRSHPIRETCAPVMKLCLIFFFISHTFWNSALFNTI